ncbi:MAG: serine/threonine-protein kinase [bacterium]|nr:serine/threonine-protein kinase [bacterium]
MTRRDENPPQPTPSKAPIAGDDGLADAADELPEDLETALYDLYFDTSADQRDARFETLLASHPEHATALRNARQALALSADALGHLRTNLEDVTSEGQYVGPFEILRVLGEGGFGTVYLAHQHAPVRRQIALKVLRQGHADERSRRRFEAERQLLARLQHPNIAQIYDAGVTDEQQHYLAMEFVDGKPITTWADQARASLGLRLTLFLSVCDAIRHAHQREVVHRDVKPSNVLVHDQDGQPVPKVIDFGIAKMLAGQPVSDAGHAIEPTLAGAHVGTPGYMSPEQAAGEWIDTRTDVYSLGVLLCELLTGEQPLPRDKLRQSSFAAMARTLAEEQPRRPSTLVGRHDRTLLERLREDLDWIVLKAVAAKRDDRYPSVAALAEDVERHLDCKPVLARQNVASYVIRKFVQRHRFGVALAAMVATALIATMSALTWGLGVVESARAEAERGRSLAETRGAAARMAVAQLALESGDAETTRDYLASVPPDRRHWGWRHLASRIERSKATLTVDTTYFDVLWLDEAHVLAFPRTGDITCWNLDTGEPEYTFEGWQDVFRRVAFAPEHGAALVAGQRELSMWNVRSGRRLKTVHTVPAEPYALAWSDDRTLAAIGGLGGWLDIVPIRSQFRPNDPHREAASPLAAAIPRKLRHRFDDNVSAIAFCGNDELLLGFERGEVRRIELLTGATLAVMQGHTDAIDHLLLDAPGNRIYTASIDTTVRAWDLQTSKPRARLTVGVRVRRLALSEKSNLLLAAGGWSDSRLAAWHTDTFEMAGRYSGHRSGIQSLAMSPDQQHIATAARDGTLRIWSIEPPRSCRVLDAGRDARVLAASSDGSRFATASFDGHVAVWNAHTLEPELQLATGTPWTGCALHGEHVYVVGRTVRALRIADRSTAREGPTNGRHVQRLIAIAETDRLFGCHGKSLLVWRLSDLSLLHEHELEVHADRIVWNPRSKTPLLADRTGVLHSLNAADGSITSSHTPFETPGSTGAIACRDDLMVLGAGRTLRFDRLEFPPLDVTTLHSSAAISPDTRRVVTGGHDNKVRLWDPDTADQLLVLGGMPYNVEGVHFVAGGTRIVALAHRWRAPCYVYVWTAPHDAELGR